MMSDVPKVLHEVAGGSLLVHAMRSGSNLNPNGQSRCQATGPRPLARCAGLR
jgi:bifunctional N-acetylglucosamine-1-phosphate-uridyltransferase/glucosamine-1-phosphate-acetyltransferase GlmU-like protein